MSTGTRSQGEVDNQVLLTDLRNDYRRLSANFQEWKQASNEEKRSINDRLAALEEKALYIPNQEESELIKEAAGFYRSKREFRERLHNTLLEKGITGLMIFVVTASFFYLKHLLAE